MFEALIEMFASHHNPAKLAYGFFLMITIMIAIIGAFTWAAFEDYANYKRRTRLSRMIRRNNARRARR